MNLAELITRIPEARVQPRGLKKEFLPLLGIAREQPARVTLHGIQPDRGAHGAELRLRRRELGREQRQRSPGEVRLKRRQILQRAGFDEFGSHAQTLEVQNARRNSERPVHSGARAGFGREVEAAENHLFGVELFADLDDRGFGKRGPFAQAQAREGVLNVVALERQHAARADRLADRFGDAFADPIQVRRSAVTPDGSTAAVSASAGTAESARIQAMRRACILLV